MHDKVALRQVYLKKPKFKEVTQILLAYIISKATGYLGLGCHEFNTCCQVYNKTSDIGYSVLNTVLNTKWPRKWEYGWACSSG